MDALYGYSHLVATHQNVPIDMKQHLACFFLEKPQSSEKYLWLGGFQY